jgi:hypothetical protein
MLLRPLVQNRTHVEGLEVEGLIRSEGPVPVSIREIAVKDLDLRVAILAFADPETFARDCGMYVYHIH